MYGKLEARKTCVFPQKPSRSKKDLKGYSLFANPNSQASYILFQTFFFPPFFEAFEAQKKWQKFFLGRKSHFINLTSKS